MSARVTFTQSSYGRFTPEFQYVLGLANEVEFFRPAPAVDKSARELIRKLTDDLARTYRSQDLTATLETGWWGECVSVMHTVEPWTDALSHDLEARWERAMSDPAIRGLVGPPLWPVPDMINVVEVVVAEKDRVLCRVPSEFSEPAWQLGCAVEKWAWSALRWCMSTEGGENLYSAAVCLATKGIYTLGRRDNELVFFTFCSR